MYTFVVIEFQFEQAEAVERSHDGAQWADGPAEGAFDKHAGNNHNEDQQGDLDPVHSTDEVAQTCVHYRYRDASFQASCRAIITKPRLGEPDIVFQEKGK